jgi:general secretion pathway protein A
MYEDYYGFVQPPFSLTPDPRFLYRSESHDIALQQVWQAIRRKEGFIVLTGDIGTGKTTLCRTILEQFDETTFTALLLNPFLSVEELLREVLLSFGVVSKESLRKGRLSSASKHELVRTLHDFLLSLVSLHGSAVLIIDEAQHLSPEVLEEIRILSNLETNDQKLLQVVIVGQLNLIDILHKAELRQLEQRVSIRCSLRPLTREELEAYVTHRLWVARGSTSVAFTPKAFDLVHAISGGVPRIINLVCDRSLMVGCEKQTHRITEDEVVGAANQLGLELPKTKLKVEREATTSAPRRVLRIAAMAVAAVLFAGAAIGGFMLGSPASWFDAGDTPAVPRPPARVLPVVVSALPAPIELTPVPIPPYQEGSFIISLGTFEDPRQVQRVEARLAELKLRPYSIDLSIEGTVQRRLLLGRFSTRPEAEEVRQKLGPSIAEALVVPSEQERYRVIAPPPPPVQP